jgi:hypothetical protein
MNDDFTFKAARRTLRTDVPLRYSNFLVGGLMLKDLHIPFIDMIPTIRPTRQSGTTTFCRFEQSVGSKNSLFGDA